MSSQLRKVKTAADRHQRECAAAWDHYLQAIHAARDAGHTLEEIGRVIGITRAGVHYLLHPDPRKEQKT